MSWTVKTERMPITEYEAWKQKIEKGPDTRHPQCEPDPEHPDYYLCSYETFVKHGKD